MGFLAKLFNRGETQRATTYDHPYVIEQPVAGFLNMKGTDGEALLRSDHNVLAPIFRTCCIRSDIDDVPKCQVLFIYCKVNGTGGIVGLATRIRDIVKEAGAYVAVVASENDMDAYLHSLEPQNGWT